MEIIFCDEQIVVCIKPPRVLSTDEPGGMPDLVRQSLGDGHADVRTVHRLDRVVSGLMVLARSAESASELSRQIREGIFQKEYLAVVHGCPDPLSGRMVDLLLRNKQERKTYVVDALEKGAQQAVLDYTTISNVSNMTKVSVSLVTGRTHQIRAQFSSRGLPLVGDRKYSTNDDGCEIALWSHRIGFCHPKTGEKMEFVHRPPDVFPWNVF